MPIDESKYTPKLINFPNDLFKKVEDYQFRNRKKSSTQAILELIEKGLEKEPKN